MPILNTLVSLLAPLNAVIAPLLKMWGIHYAGKVSERKDNKINTLKEKIKVKEQLDEIHDNNSSLSRAELINKLRK